MRRVILSEKSLVVVLFIFVLIIFSLAQEDTKKIEKMYLDSSFSATVPGKDVNPASPEIKPVISSVQLR